MQLRFLKGNWEFGKFKLQYRDCEHPKPCDWIDVPTVLKSDLEPKGEEKGPVELMMDVTKKFSGETVPNDLGDLVKPERGTEWVCPKCGATKLDNFCGYDGTLRPQDKSTCKECKRPL